MDTAGVRKRATTKGDATREAIKKAGKQVFALVGFHNAKISDITAAANRSPAAFYLYYRSKEEMLADLLDELRNRLKQSINRPMPPGQTAVENLSQSIRAFWQAYREDWSVASAAFQLSMVNKDFALAWRNLRQQGIRALSAVIRRMQTEGESPGLNPELAASALCSMIEYSCYNWTASGGDFPERNIDDSEAIDVLTRLIVHSLSRRDSASTLEALAQPG